MSGMNKELQMAQIRKMLEKSGTAADLVDVSALVDGSISLPENIKNLERHLGIKLYVETKKDTDAIIEAGEDMVREGNGEMLQQLLDGKPKAEPVTERDELKNTMIKIMSTNKGLRDVLENIAADEESKGYGEDGSDGAQGWKYGAVPGLVGHLHVLIQNKIIKRTRDTPDIKEFMLVDRDATKEAVLAWDEQQRTKKAESSRRQCIGFLGGITVSPEDIVKFKDILSKNDGLEYWFNAIAPKIAEMDYQKKAVLLSLASLDDKFGDVNRIGVLLYGPPGTGKSELRNAAIRYGAEGCSHRTSGVGLTMDGSGDEPTPGVLPRNHKGAAAIDEVDKMPAKDQAGLLEAMSNGTVTVNVGKVSERMPAEVIVIMCANEITALKPELVDRCDFVLKCDTYSTSQAKSIKTNIVRYWNAPKPLQEQDLAKFLKWCRTFEPGISDAVREEVDKLLETYIDLSHETAPRRFEGIMRIALAIARLNYRDMNVGDVQNAIKIFNERRNDRVDGMNGKNGR
jgi:hypothetical protein